jgi:uncharacterized membrane protein
MNQPQRLQQKIDAYVVELRRCLGELPPEEVSDILQEIRGHILERAEASGELTEERLVAILKNLGRPEEIAPLYQTESLMARARTSFSPALVLRGMLRWAMLSVKGFVLFLVGLFGYSLALGLLACAVAKFIWPHEVGAWVTPSGLSLGTNSNPAAREVLGWWIVPVGLIVGSLLLVGTTRLLRWFLRFARTRRPTERGRAA